MNQEAKIVLPFNKIATHEVTRRPMCLLDQPVQAWLADRNHRIDFLMAGDYRNHGDNWRVTFCFANKADAIAFKLTFG